MQRTKTEAALAVLIIIVIALSLGGLLGPQSAFAQQQILFIRAGIPTTGTPDIGMSDTGTIENTTTIDTNTASQNPALGHDHSLSLHYKDISKADWFYDKVISLAINGIVGGYSDGSFKPRKSITRAEMASFLARAKSLQATGTEPFGDVNETDWFSKDVAAVLQAGIMNGTTPALFSPSGLLTREQVSAIIVRAAGMDGVTDIQEQNRWLQGLKDRRSISLWARPYAAAAIKYNLMGGYPSKELRPSGVVTRAETSVLIWNILYKEIRESGGYPTYVAPYLPKPTIIFPQQKQVVFTKNYSVTAQIDPESSTQELWVNEKLVQIKHASGSNTVTFTGLKAINRTYSISVRTKNGSASTSTGVVSYYCLQAPSNHDHLIVIDKSEFRLYWIIDGFLKKIYQVAIGRDGMATPNAEWIVGQKYKTDPKGVYGPRKMRLYGLINGTYEYTRYGIHGTNEPWVIGTRASHGCIRLRNKDILDLWPQVGVGDHVITQP